MSLAWRKGYEYNYPLLFKQYDKELPSLPEFFDVEVVDKFKHVFRKDMSIVSVENPNIILQVLKVPEKLILDLEEAQTENNNNENHAPNRHCQVLHLRNDHYGSIYGIVPALPPYGPVCVIDLCSVCQDIPI